ncbi:hypothetical protein GQ55_7G071100 [Panicum hallii var. hallii]|uniref:Uncharacterized protein n=1 Tax=Panicum hallii var. hallii TaxID=1504633 RepID=A0A2T7CSV0_9POAL|nr:hypothetical protein GQ55_7G071100 [Panicum hallii var. hallii]
MTQWPPYVVSQLHVSTRHQSTPAARRGPDGAQTSNLRPPPRDVPQPAARRCRRRSLHRYAPSQLSPPPWRPRRSSLSRSHRAARVLRACLNSRFHCFLAPLL